MTKRVLFLASTLGILVAMGAGCLTTPTPAAPALVNGEQPVAISNFSFQPQDVTIPVGATIVWTNQDTAPHSIAADDGSFNSENLTMNSIHRRVFTTAGSFPYHCGVHPNMHGTIIVK